MKRVALFFFTFVVIPGCSFSQSSHRFHIAGENTAVFRPPFVLKLRIDKQHYYEERFEHIPYVADGAVYLFAGETLGVNLTIRADQILRISYQPDLAKADITFEFKQQQGQSGLVMLLIIGNALKQKVRFDALMTIPGDKELHETSILPVGSGRTNTESWPHPIVQLKLENFRFSESGVL
ncbi:MAG TPA: hypothetical protein VGN16_04125 [Acidobacteriaceae bacterium]